ncbi:MAG TPA: exonuclease domain-containing protein [bacterium]|nr:exonuclease domain-containing protein [bacterium]
MQCAAPDIVVSLDLETTGLHPFFAEIVEVGAVAFRPGTGEVVDTFHSLVNPGVPIPETVIKIHGITDDMVADAPRLTTVFDALVDFLHPSMAVLGHNVAFDLGFLRHRATKLGRPLPPTTCIDSVRLAKWAFPGLASYRLVVLCQLLGLELIQAHRALNDAQATRALYLRAMGQLHLLGHGSEAVFGRVLKPIDDGRNSPENIPPDLIHLYRACEDRLRLRITYANAQRETTRRVIDPVGMQMVSGSHYMVAHCHFKQANRNFRVDRILEWEVVGEVPLEELLAGQGMVPTAPELDPGDAFEPAMESLDYTQDEPIVPDAPIELPDLPAPVSHSALGMRGVQPG